MPGNRSPGQIMGDDLSSRGRAHEFSFEVAIRELNGQVIFLNANDIQLGQWRGHEGHHARAGPNGPWR